MEASIPRHFPSEDVACRGGYFKVIVGGSGDWQISQTDCFEEPSVDCVVEGGSESDQTLELFQKAIHGEGLPRFIQVNHPTGCGRRCNFCLPDLNPQIDFPKEKIMEAVRANVRDGNDQISPATEDMYGDRIGADGETDRAGQRRAFFDRRMAQRAHSRRIRTCRTILDLLYEVKRRGLFAFFGPSIFTPLHDTRLAAKRCSGRS